MDDNDGQVLDIPFDRRIKVQAECLDDIDARYLMMQGGFGSGKTYLGIGKTLQLSQMNKDVAGGIMAPSGPEFKRDFLPEMLDIMSAHIPGAQYFSSGKFGAFFTFPWTKAPVYIFSAERRVKGPNLGWGVINEFSLMPWVRIWEFIGRRRINNVPAPQIVFAGTPEDEYGWLDKFITTHGPTGTGRLVIRHATTFDNTFNDPEYGKELLENLDEDTAQIYVYGRQGRLGGDFFYYSYKEQVNDWDGAEYDDSMTVHVGLDFNVGRMSASFWHIYNESEQRRKQMAAFDELLITGNDANTTGMARAIKARYGTENVLITCDASGKARKTTGLSDVKELEAHGFKVRYRTANPKIKQSQIQVNGLLAKRRILINPVTCPNLKKDFNKVKQLKDFEQDKTNEQLTHFGDGARYLAAFEYPNVLDQDRRQKLKILRMGVR